MCMFSVGTKGLLRGTWSVVPCTKWYPFVFVLLRKITDTTVGSGYAVPCLGSFSIQVCYRRRCSHNLGMHTYLQILVTPIRLDRAVACLEVYVARSTPRWLVRQAFLKKQVQGIGVQRGYVVVSDYFVLILQSSLMYSFIGTRYPYLPRYLGAFGSKMGPYEENILSFSCILPPFHIQTPPLLLLLSLYPQLQVCLITHSSLSTPLNS